MSLAAPFAPLPVLSPIIQAGSRPARNLLSPVVLPNSQDLSRSLDAGDSTLLVTSLRSVAPMASGVLVSRSSPSRLLFREGSLRSRRVVLSPIERNQAVKPCGPPIVSS